MNPIDQRNIERVMKGFWESLLPPPPIPVSEWAATTRQLSREGSAETGLWRNRPFQAEMLDVLGPDSPYQQVVLMLASQLTKTEVAINFLGYIIDRDPGPVLIVEPRVEDAKALSKDRVAPMIRDTPELRAKMSAPDSHSGPVGNTRSNNTTLHKKFKHGHVTFTGASKPSGLAMRPIRYLMLDEIDRYPATAGREGDPCMLAIRRTDEFYWNKKILMCSTPTVDGMSRIAQAYDESDQRRPHVPCPFCGEFQELEFFHLEWEKDQPQTAKYRCDSCTKHIPASHKDWMLAHGKWVVTHPESPIAGFWLSQMYSTRRTWGDIATEYLLAKKTPETHRVFVNTVLALTWKERGEAPDWRKLYDRAESYPLRQVPMGGLFLTAGCDVQEDRLEVMVTAWGRNMENWLIDYIVIEGSVRLTKGYLLPNGARMQSVWDRLNDVLTRTYPHASGRDLPIEKLALDSGYATQEVYSWARRTQHARAVMVIKGSDAGPSIVNKPVPVDVNFEGKKITHGIKYWPLNVSMLKNELYNRLRLDPPTRESGDEYPPGYCHFPEMGEDFFRQLTAEQLETTTLRGYKKQHWIKHGRNEVLDTKNYARAAAYQRGIDNFKEKNWREYEERLGIRVHPGVLMQQTLDLHGSVAVQEPPAAVVTTPEPATRPQVQRMTKMPRRTRVIPPNWQY